MRDGTVRCRRILHSRFPLIRPPNQARVQAIQDEVNELLAALLV
jgi:hypothetical protein